MSVPAAPLRIAAVGVGAHATAAILPSLPAAGLRLVATCALHRENARDAADRFGAEAAYDDVAAMLDEVRPDGVVVVVPPAAFSEVIACCLDRRVPVFTEKPAANDAAEAAALAQAATKRGVPIVVGYMKRFAGAYRRAKEICTQPEFGPLTLGSFTWSMGPFADRFDLRDWLFENPVHHFDLARFFFGELEDIRVLRAPGTEHTIVVTARSETGAIVNVRANTTGSWQQRNESVELCGDGHSIFVENLDTCIWRPPQAPELVWRPNYTVPTTENMSGATMGFVTELQHFRDVLLGAARPESDMANAAATLSLTSRIAEQALELT